VVEAFHGYLKGALAQARAEHLLDNDTLASAEADIMSPVGCSQFLTLNAV